MMSLDNIDNVFVKTVFAGDTTTNLRMCSLDVMIHSFPEIMEQSSLECKYWICANHFGYSFCDIGDLLRVHENILPITRTESEFSDQGENLIRNTDHAHLFDGLATEIVDELVSILLILLDNLFDTSWLYALVFDEFFERLLRDIAPKKIKTREKYGIRGIINDEGNSCCLLEGNDIATFFPDEFSLQVIALECYQCLSGLSGDFRCILLNGFDDDLTSSFTLTRLEILLFLIDE